MIRDDLDFIELELTWAETRLRRLAAEAELEQRRKPDLSAYRGHDEDTLTRLQARVQQLKTQEASARRDADTARTTFDGPLALEELCQRFGLDDFERNVLLLCAAPCFASRFGDLFGEVAGMRGLTVELAFRFQELTFRDRIERRSTFKPSSRLLANDLVRCDIQQRWTSAKDLLDADLLISQRVFAYLVGRQDLDDEFVSFSSLEEPLATFDQVVLPDPEMQRIRSVVDQHDELIAKRQEWGFDEVIRYGRSTLILFHGPPGTGKTMTAHAIAAHAGKRVLNVDIPTFVTNREAERFLPGLFREARLQNALLFFDECEVLFGNRRHGNLLMTLLLTELERFEGIAVLATNLPAELDEALARRVLVRVRFPEPDRHGRAEIWRRHLPESAPLAEDIDVDRLAERYEFSGGFIKNAVLGAVAWTVHEQAPEITHAHLEKAAQEQLQRFDADGEPLVVPTERLADLVLPSSVKAQVDQLLSSVRSAPTVLRRWGVGGPGGNLGVAALLHGLPGTGKTLCAKALAGELNRPLKVVRASGLLSKWVGDSERNLQAAFDRARADQAVLLVDEADSLLLDRAHAGQRHELSLVNTLLDLVENHPGLVLLATNLPDRLDNALARRLACRIHFTRPGPAERLALWQRMLPDSAPLHVDVSRETLAERFDLSGAEIRKASLHAASSAANEGRCVRMADLLAACASRERPARRVGFKAG